MKSARNGASISSCRPTEPQKRSLVDISSLCFHSCIPSSEPFLWFEWCAAVPSVCQDDELLGGGQGGQRNRVNRVKNGLPMSSFQANAKKEKEIHSIWFAEFWRCHSVLVHGILFKKTCFLNVFSPQKATWPVSSPEKVWQPSHGGWRLWTGQWQHWIGKLHVFACIWPSFLATQNVWDNMSTCICLVFVMSFFWVC